MPRCYLLALSQSSSLDKGTNNLSLFHLVEALTLPRPEGPLAVMVEAHVYWQAQPEELGTSIEFRLVRRALGGSVEHGGVFTLALTHRRFRFRTGGFQLPSTDGSWELGVEWRPVGEAEWRTDSVWWPLDVHYTMADDQHSEPTAGGG